MKNIFYDHFKRVTLTEVQDAIAKAIGDTIQVKVAVELNAIEFNTEELYSSISGEPLVGTISGSIRIRPNESNTRFLNDPKNKK